MTWPLLKSSALSSEELLLSLPFSSLSSSSPFLVFDTKSYPTVIAPTSTQKPTHDRSRSVELMYSVRFCRLLNASRISPHFLESNCKYEYNLLFLYFEIHSTMFLWECDAEHGFRGTTDDGQRIKSHRAQITSGWVRSMSHQCESIFRLLHLRHPHLHIISCFSVFQYLHTCGGAGVYTPRRCYYTYSSRSSTSSTSMSSTSVILKWLLYYLNTRQGQQRRKVLSCWSTGGHTQSVLIQNCVSNQTAAEIRCYRLSGFIDDRTLPLEIINN